MTHVQFTAPSIPTRGVGRSVVHCTGAPQVTQLNVRALTGQFQLGSASATATLTVVGDPPATFSDSRTIEVVFR